MTRLLCLITLALPALAADVPDEVVAAAAMVESSSYFRADGTLRWVNRTRGDGGRRRGPFQMGRLAFRDVAKRGDYFANLEVDMQMAERLYRAYLIRWHKPGESWWRTAERWNAGPTGGSAWYRKRLEAAVDVVRR